MARRSNHGPTGVRLNQKQDERCRASIQTTALLHRLSDFALDQPCRYTRQPFTMSDTQVRAALGLLRKTIPDLAVTEIRGDADHPVQFVIRGPSPVESANDWLRLHAPQTIDTDD